jgi:hypothetical protein
MRNRVLSFLLIASAAGTACTAAKADETHAKPLESGILAFIQANCLRCHKGERPKGKLALAQFQTASSMTGDPKRWGRITSKASANRPRAETYLVVRCTFLADYLDCKSKSNVDCLPDTSEVNSELLCYLFRSPSLCSYTIFCQADRGLSCR